MVVTELKKCTGNARFWRPSNLPLTVLDYGIRWHTAVAQPAIRQTT